MKALFLFFTQGEAGAPEYLSRTGEQGAETFAETISTFISESLKIPINTSYSERAKSLNDEVIWRSFKQQSDFSNAMKASLQFYSEVLIVAGNENRTLKTAETLAKTLALPVCVDNRIDKYKESKPFSGTLTTSLIDLIGNFEESLCPKIVLVGTAMKPLLEWVESHKNLDEVQQFAEILNISSENDSIPAVFIAGMNRDDNNISWVMDLPKIIN
ncbi:hypothetical protein QEJ31_04145 [Pigmentibacter sp. JX0631]|uniref:hypothetical protein n=1 Tax=Pigmentibacter sp. JX0631 TaxID=2976982 RepID=UPI0024687565|nr:hypothetical protein [Pigmentibacter sp. JX0631]WGL60786.1 hypothetical protein QEJ31_04145 [Pigmentibacter sp. JX0631]